MAADATYQGVGLKRRQNGTTAIPSGGSLDVESGGAFKIAGTTVTSSAAALNALLPLAGADAAFVATVANANVIGGIPVIYRVDIADASADTDVVLTYKTRVLDAWAVNTGIAAHASLDTWQIKNGTNAISAAVAKTATVNAIKRIATIDPAYQEIAAAGTLRVTAAKNTNAAVTLYVLGVLVA